MNLISKLSDNDLLDKTKTLVNEEKRMTQEVLSHLEEIEYRKLYLARGFSSLFDYCVKELKYSESSALRRISAMRLIRSIPEAKEKLEKGSVNLSTLSQLQGFLKREGKTFSKEAKLDFLEKIENKSQNQCERELLKISPIDFSSKEKMRVLTEELTQHTFVATNELSKKLELLRNLIAHKNSNPTMAELIELAADVAIEKLNPMKHKFTSATEVRKVTIHEIDKNKKSGKNTRHIPSPLRHYIWNRDQGHCQYIDKETNKKCESKFALQIDHVHPFSLGGNNQKENLRLLCRSHNVWRTKELFRY